MRVRSSVILIIEYSSLKSGFYELYACSKK